MTKILAMGSKATNIPLNDRHCYREIRLGMCCGEEVGSVEGREWILGSRVGWRVGLEDGTEREEWGGVEVIVGGGSVIVGLLTFVSMLGGS